MLIQGGSKVVHFSSHHIFGTVQDKIKRISPKCSDSFWEYRLGCISYAAGKYSLQISSVLVYRKMATSVAAPEGRSRVGFSLCEAAERRRREERGVEAPQAPRRAPKARGSRRHRRRRGRVWGGGIPSPSD